MLDPEDAYDAEPPPSPSNERDTSDADDVLHISSLRPTTDRFSMRRQLNWASLVVLAVVVMALAFHWLPDAIHGHLNRLPPQAVRTTSPSIGLVRGVGWQRAGPNWGQSIAFAANANVGYVCGALGPGDAPVLISRFDAARPVSENIWTQFTSPATGNTCHISVSPSDAGDVVLATTSCLNCPQTAADSSIYRSHDGGKTWLPLHLPRSLPVVDMVQTDAALFLATWDNAAAGGTTPQLYHLFVSVGNGPLTEVTTEQIVGHATHFGRIAMLASRSTLYLSLDEVPCPSYCTTLARTDDAGAHWAFYAANYQGNPIIPAAAQANSKVLIGWTPLPSFNTQVMLQSSDDGMDWQPLPDLPGNLAPMSPFVSIVKDGSVYAWYNEPSSTVYALYAGASSWQEVAPLPTGLPLTVQDDADGHATALWGLANALTADRTVSGLEYFPLAQSG
jgi:hypothetical protein